MFRDWLMLRPRLSHRRSFSTAAGGLLLLCLSLGCWTAARAAGPQAKLRTVQYWQWMTEQHLTSPRAFIKGDRIRIVFSNSTSRVLFTADWDKLRVPARDFEVSTAVLRHDKTPANPPVPKSGWREVTVLSGAAWEQLSEKVMDAWTPAQPNHGLYFQAPRGDGVLYRDPGGAVRFLPLNQKPPEMLLVQRYSMTETAAALAGLVEENLTLRQPADTSFLLLPPDEDRPVQPALLNFKERKCVLLSPPHLASDRYGGPRLGATMQGITSLLFESHLYALLKNPVSSLARLGNLGCQQVVSLTGPPLRQCRSEIPPLTDRPGMSLTGWEQWLDRHTSTRRRLGSLRLLIDGEQFFPRFQQALDSATNYIRILVCIFDNDDVAVEIADLLKRRAADIEVKVLMDRMSSSASGTTPPGTPLPEGFVYPRSIRAYLKKDSNILLRTFLNPWFTADHSKVFLVDGRRAWIGGMNLGREYRYEWHDLMVEVEGPMVASFEQAFSLAWSHAGLLGDLAFASRGLFSEPPPEEASIEGPPMELRRLSTRTGRPMICKAVLESLRRAQNHIFLENPYLFDNRVIVSLAKARLRGVDVRVVLPSLNDLAGADRSNLVTANYLFEHGVRVYFYPGMTHVKALLADGWSCVGSANFNNLSLRLNQEDNIGTSNPDFAARLKEKLFETDFAKSREMTEALTVNWIDHLADGILRHF